MTSPRQKFTEAHPDLWKFFLPIKSLSTAWENKNVMPATYEPKQNLEVGPGQMKWAKLCDDAVKEAVRMFDEKHPDTQSLLESYFKIFAPLRMKIGGELGHHPNYGKPRVEDRSRLVSMREWVEPLGKYSSQYEQIKDRILELFNSSPTSRFSVHFHTGKNDNNASYTTKEIGIYGEGMNSKAQIRNILYCSLTLTMLTLADGRKKEYIEATHTRNADVMDVLRLANKYYQAALVWKKSDNRHELFWNVGLLAYHLAHAIPLLLGSSATTEILISSILQSKFIPPKCFTGDMAWDFRAYITPDPEDFAEYFCCLYEEREYRPKQGRKRSDELKPTLLPEISNHIIWDDLEDTSSLLINDGIPFAERCPNRWRTPYDRYRINRSGAAEFNKQTNEFAKKYVDQILKTHPQNPKLRFLEKEAGFLAVCLKVIGNYYDESFSHLSDIVEYVNASEEGRLEEIRDEFLRSQKIFNWLDSLPYSRRRDVAAKISDKDGKKGVLNKSDIDLIEKFMRRVDRIEEKTISTRR
ncbi:MAG: hypothetical protein ACYCQI_05100 [Gammaproteobacteria bacterium]